jgi:hypothetical protein
MTTVLTLYDGAVVMGWSEMAGFPLVTGGIDEIIAVEASFLRP